MIRTYSHHEAGHHWHRAQPFVERALQAVPCGLASRDVRDALNRGDMQLWSVEDGDTKAMLVTQIVPHPEHRVCQVYLGAGDDMDSWLPDFVSRLEQWARNMGCQWIDVAGRKGWERIGQSFGFRHAYSVVRKEI